MLSLHIQTLPRGRKFRHNTELQQRYTPRFNKAGQPYVSACSVLNKTKCQTPTMPNRCREAAHQRIEPEH